jgi:hypothetical protein
MKNPKKKRSKAKTKSVQKKSGSTGPVLFAGFIIAGMIAFAMSQQGDQ